MEIKYTLKRSRKRRKTISLNISRNNEIVVYAPYFTPIREVNQFISEKQKWIDKTIRQQATAPRVKEKDFVTGEIFYYLGKGYPLETFFEPREKIGLLLWNGRFYLNAPENREIQKDCFISWYKQKAVEHVRGRVEYFHRQFNLRPRSVRVSPARQRWGSCSPDNKLAFSFRLIMMPPEAIDYVVVHELMHIREKSHSRRFWKLVEEVMPHYKTCQKRLKELDEQFTF